MVKVNLIMCLAIKQDNQIMGAEGVKYITDALHINSSLTNLCLKGLFHLNIDGESESHHVFGYQTGQSNYWS